MQLLSVLDPALLIYSFEEWQKDNDKCLTLINSLGKHREIFFQFNFRLATTYEFTAILWNLFPNNRPYKSIPMFREVQNVLYQDLQRAKIVKEMSYTMIDFNPPDIVCKNIDNTNIISTWNRLLIGCLNEDYDSLFIATYKNGIETSCPDAISIKYQATGRNAIDEEVVPLVFDEKTWAKHIVVQEWWPEFKHDDEHWQNLVKTFYNSNEDIQNLNSVSKKPFSFTCIKDFWKCADGICRTKKEKIALIETITYKTFKILSDKIQDEKIKGTKNTFRMRLSKKFRIHYEPTDDGILLTECGPHGIGGIQ